MGGVSRAMKFTLMPLPWMNRPACSSLTFMMKDSSMPSVKNTMQRKPCSSWATVLSTVSMAS